MSVVSDTAPPATDGGLTVPTCTVPPVPGGTLMVTEDSVEVAETPKLKV